MDRSATPPKPGDGSPAGPGSNQAKYMLRSMDANKDGKIGKDKAAADMKANCAMVDGNGDGGIDIDELTAAL